MYSLVLYIKGGVPALPFNLCWMLNKETLIPTSPYRKVRGGGDFFFVSYIQNQQSHSLVFILKIPNLKYFTSNDDYYC